MDIVRQSRLPPLLLAGIALAAPGPSVAQEPAVDADTVERIDPVPLPPLRVEAAPTAPRGKMRGFHRRRRRHPGGVFIDRRQIERRNPRRLSDLVHAVAGLAPGPRPGGVEPPALGNRRASPVPGRRPCRVRYFVDGAPYPPGTGFRIDLLAPDDVEAIEIYRGASGVPARFDRRRDRCGVVVIWTRDPGGGAPGRP